MATALAAQMTIAMANATKSSRPIELTRIMCGEFAIRGSSLEKRAVGRAGHFETKGKRGLPVARSSSNAIRRSAAGHLIRT